MTMSDETDLPGSPPHGLAVSSSSSSSSTPEFTDLGAGPTRRRIAQSRSPSWWHRSHPVFAPLSGFFTGLLLIVVAIAGYGALLNAVAGDDHVKALLPLGLVVFIVPLALIAVPRSRRFGVYLLVGMLATAVVIGASAGITLWILLR